MSETHRCETVIPAGMVAHLVFCSVPCSALWALLPSWLRWWWNQRRWGLPGAPTVLLSGSPLQQGRLRSARGHCYRSLSSHVRRKEYRGCIEHVGFWCVGVQQHRAPIHLHAIQPEPVVIRAEPQWGEGGPLGRQGSPVTRRRTQELGRWRQEDRWTQRGVSLWAQTDDVEPNKPLCSGS